jgi:hypothetical protein
MTQGEIVWNISDQVVNAVAGGAVGALITLGVMVLLSIIIALYVYTSLAWMTIFRKLKYKNPWMAWIPIVNIAPMLQLGGFHWAWIFLILIPIVGWIPLAILVIIATWRIFEMRNYPGWFSLSMIIPKIGFILYLIAIGFVAWDDRKSGGVSLAKEVSKKRKVSKKKRKR